MDISAKLRQEKKITGFWEKIFKDQRRKKNPEHQDLQEVQLQI